MAQAYSNIRGFVFLPRMSEVDDWRWFRASGERSVQGRSSHGSADDYTIGVVASRRDCAQLREFVQLAPTDTLPRDSSRVDTPILIPLTAARCGRRLFLFFVGDQSPPLHVDS